MNYKINLKKNVIYYRVTTIALTIVHVRDSFVLRNIYEFS